MATEAAQHSIVVAPQQTRTRTPLNVVGEEVLVKISGVDTKNSFAFFHLAAPPMSGPPLHVHSREDELFYVLEGELVFQLGDARKTVATGTTVFAPRGTVHAYQNFTDRTGRLLIMVTPSGMEHFFEELSLNTPSGGMPALALLENLHAKYGLKTMGPPLS